MRCALIVSVNRYTNYGPLRYCHTDGHLLAQTLTSLCDYHRRCTVRHLKLDREAGHELPGRLLAAIREIDAADQASVRSGDDPAGDSFLFYFAGHGVHDAATQRSYLLLPGSRPDALAETALSLGALREALSGLRRPIVQIVDACHSGEAHRGEPGSRSPELRGFVSELKRDVDLGEEVGHDGQFGWETFAACDEGEYSHEAHELQHGVFTHALAQAIRGAPVGAALQLASLKDVVCGEVRRWTTDRGLVQNPVFAARTYGAHCFARRNHQPVPPTSFTSARGEPAPTRREVCHSVDLPAREEAAVNLDAYLRPASRTPRRFQLKVNFDGGRVSYELDAPDLNKGGRRVARPKFSIAPDQHVCAGPYDWHLNRLRFQFNEHQAVVTSFALDGSEVGIHINIP